jgi:pimeloyl-ACP methyl ester carboxylesterase
LISVSPRDAILSLLVVAVLLAAGLCLLVYLMQERLIFFPQRLDERAALAIQQSYPRAAAFELVGEDGVRVRGWLVGGAIRRASPLLIYFGGNGEEVSWLVAEFSRVADRAALLMNYRGYGLSDGHPSEAMLYQDALALYDRATRRPDIDPGRIIVMGRSLGTGVATYLASQRPVAGVVLISPYDTLVQVARGAYPFLPVNLLLRHRFESVERAPSIHAPLLALVAARDNIVRPERSRALVQAWGGPARLEVLDGVDHNSIHSHPDYWRLIDAFVAERTKPAPVVPSQ